MKDNKKLIELKEWIDEVVEKSEGGWDFKISIDEDEVKHFISISWTKGLSRVIAGVFSIEK